MYPGLALTRTIRFILLLQRCDGVERVVLLPLDPIVARLMFMQFGPVENQPEGTARQLSLDEFQRLDRDFRLIVAVYRVEVRGW